MSRTSSLRRALALAAWVGCARVAAAQVTVLDPWVRGTVEGQPSTAAYLTLRSDSAVRLVSVTSPVAARCSVHEMSISGTLMRMRTIDISCTLQRSEEHTSELQSHLNLVCR